MTTKQSERPKAKAPPRPLLHRATPSCSARLVCLRDPLGRIPCALGEASFLRPRTWLAWLALVRAGWRWSWGPCSDREVVDYARLHGFEIGGEYCVPLANVGVSEIRGRHWPCSGERNGVQKQLHRSLLPVYHCMASQVLCSRVRTDAQPRAPRHWSISHCYALRADPTMPEGERQHHRRPQGSAAQRRGAHQRGWIQ